MRIISMKRDFTSDHSSTSYEFLAVDKPLGKKEKKEVSSLSSRANPTSRRVSFVYHVDGYDIPGGWESLMNNYYDVMYREDYGWWTLAIAFKASPEQIAELNKYEFDGDEEQGSVRIMEKDGRITVVIYCRLDASCIEYDDEEVDEETEEIGSVFVAENGLLNLLVQIREQLKQGDYRALYAVWEHYGFSGDYEYEGEEFEVPPVPAEKPHRKNIIEQFKSMLE